VVVVAVAVVVVVASNFDVIKNSLEKIKIT
jgi:hypothetical protein